MVTNSNAVPPPDGEADLLYGTPAIAAHLKLTEKQVYHLHANGDLPTFKLGAKVCARRSTLAEFFARQEKVNLDNVEATGTRLGRLSGKTVIIGLRAISEYLDISIPAAGQLYDRGRLPTYLDRRRRISAKRVDLDAFLADKEAGHAR